MYLCRDSTRKNFLGALRLIENHIGVDHARAEVNTQGNPAESSVTLKTSTSRGALVTARLKRACVMYHVN